MSAAFGAAWLMDQEFPETKYVVPGIVPEGMSLLVAAPKIGKSWMALGLGLDLSTGGMAFGALPVGDPRPVLYLALEDGKRRLQSRIKRLDPPSISDSLEFMVEVPQGQVVPTIADFILRHDGLDPVVFLDTLGKVMPPATNGSSAYAHDYGMLSALKSTTDRVPGSSLLIVHHTRKHDGGDFLDAVSGTQGIAGAADTVLVLRRERHDNRATLQVTSRDAAEGEYSLTLSDSGAWELDGKDLAEASRAAESVRATAGLGEKSSEVIETVGRYPEGIKVSDLRVLLPNVKNLDEYLSRAVESERIQKLGRGLYAPVRSVSSVSLPPLETHTLTQLTPSYEGEV